MKTHELLATPESQLVPQLRNMKLKELEKHAEKLLKRFGQPDYDAVMRTLIRAIPELGVNEQDRYQAVQGLVKSHLALDDQAQAESKDAVQRITVILMVIIKKKFMQIHHGTSH